MYGMRVLSVLLVQFVQFVLFVLLAGRCPMGSAHRLMSEL